MNALFSRLSGSLAIAVLLLFLPSSAVGQIWIDERQVGSPHTNRNNVNTADVWGSHLLTNLARIGTASISWGGEVSNENNAHIGTVDMRNDISRLVNRNNATIDTLHVVSGRLDNMDNARINTANLSGGGQAINTGSAHIDIANVTGTRLLSNVNRATIGTANIRNSGNITNMTYAHIGTANIYDNGRLSNSGDAINNPGNTHPTIGTVNTYGNARLSNSNRATIDTVNVRDSSRVDNAGGGARINTLSVANSGQVNNYHGATIGSVFLNGGILNNISSISNLTYTGGTYNNRQVIDTNGSSWTGAGTIGTLNVAGNSAHIDWGNNVTSLNNQATGTVGNFTMSSGRTVTNAGTINNLTYNGGTYNGGSGTIGTLTVAGNLTGDNWGTVNNLEFASNGSGFVSIGGFADGSFSGIRVAESVNMANGNFQFNLSGTVDDWFGTAFGWEDIFGGASLDSSWEAIGWEDALFRVSWDDYSTDWFGQQWNLGNGYFVAFDAAGMTSAAIPEPATLAIIGLGIAGLGLARRRMKR